MTTRVEATTAIEAVFAPYNIPVVADPLSAVKPPAIIVAPGNPYRSPDTACWTQNLEVTVIAGRLDDVDVYDTLDDMADTFCRTVRANIGLTNHGAAAAPGVRTIGDVDYLACVFSVTAYDIGPGLT